MGSDNATTCRLCGKGSGGCACYSTPGMVVGSVSQLTTTPPPLNGEVSYYIHAECQECKRLRAEVERLTQERDEAMSELGVWMDRANDFSKQLEQAEDERDLLRAALEQCLDAHRRPWAYGMDIRIVSAQAYSAHRLEVERALGGK